MARRHSDNTIEQAYLLHDHLEAIITYAHKLQSGRLTLPQAISHEARADNAFALSEFIDTIKSTELVIVTKILRARLWASRLQPVDQRFDPMVRLFLSGTHALADSVQDSDSPAVASFGSPAQHRDYLIARQVIPANTYAFDMLTEFDVSGEFLLNGTTAIAPLMENCRTFADMLDTHFQLYEPVPAVVKLAEFKERPADSSNSDEPEPRADISADNTDTGNIPEGDAGDSVPAPEKQGATLAERLAQLES